MKNSKVIEIQDDLALSTARKLIRLGFSVGPSSGSNYAAALKAVEEQGIIRTTWQFLQFTSLSI